MREGLALSLPSASGGSAGADFDVVPAQDDAVAENAEPAEPELFEAFGEASNLERRRS